MLCAPGPSWLSRRPPPTGLEGCGAPRAPATVVFKIQQCQGGCDRKAGEEASTPQESSAGTGNLGSRCQHPFQGSRHRSALCHVAIFVLLQRYVQHARMWIWAAELRSGLSCHAMSALSWLLSSESAAVGPIHPRGREAKTLRVWRDRRRMTSFLLFGSWTTTVRMLHDHMYSTHVAVPAQHAFLSPCVCIQLFTTTLRPQR